MLNNSTSKYKMTRPNDEALAKAMLEIQSGEIDIEGGDSDTTDQQKSDNGYSAADFPSDWTSEDFELALKWTKSKNPFKNAI